LHNLLFVNIVNIMSNSSSPKESNIKSIKDQDNKPLLGKGLYVREDDQDWGSGGMNNIQIDSEENQ